MNLMERVERRQLKKKVPVFRPGDTVRVHTKILEGDKERVQIFEGVVIKRRGSAINESITVRKVSYGVGVERIFQVHSPMIDRIEVKQRGTVRRAKLYHLRELTGRAARIEEKRLEEKIIEEDLGAVEAETPIEVGAKQVEAEEKKSEVRGPKSEVKGKKAKSPAEKKKNQ